jgi:hypothetical protein
MGLDMYLTADRFLWNNEEGNLSEKLYELFGYPIERVQSPVGYWCKVYDVHLWFVKNVQGGKDNCRKHEVERDQLNELLEIVNEILERHEKASVLLPVGNRIEISYDDNYFQSLEETRFILEKALNMDENWIFYYNSSW